MAAIRGVELDKVELSGARLLLRPWRADDAERIVTALQDRAMHEFLALPDPYTAADAAEFIGRSGDSATELARAVVERTSGRVVGSCALRLSADPEIGYWIAPDAQGCGYAAEATGLLSDWAFGHGLRRLRLVCDVRNEASARTALAAGFRFEGVGRDGVIGGGTGSVPERRGDVARFARLAGDPPGRLPYAFAPLVRGGLDDGVLRLRTMRSDDGPALIETDDELTLRWSFTGRPHPPAEVQRAAEQAGLQWLVGTVAAFTMEDLATGRVAGSVRVRQAGPPQVGGVGYVVHPAFRGRRLTTRGLRLLVDWALGPADFARLELGAKVANQASLRAAAAAGFEPDGIRRCRLRNPDGTFSDEQRYVLLNPRYR